jgi:hypothetical protein
VPRGAEPVAGPALRAGDRRFAALRRHAGPVALALALAAWVHGRALGTFFAQDDITLLSWAAGLSRADWLLRPLSQGAFRVEYALFGLDPLGYHAVNLALHLLDAGLVYALAFRLAGSRGVATAAAVLFGVSAIAFTPLHWATSVGELLAAGLLLGATLLWLGAGGRSATWRWAAALLALAAMFCKETAAAWVIVVALLEARAPRPGRSWRALAPAVAVSAVFLAVYVATGRVRQFDSAAAYAVSASPLFLTHNLSTYVRWCVALGEPIRDVVAAADPHAWRVALPLVLALALVPWGRSRAERCPVEIGVAWWLAFLSPVLPLVHHTYLYYLYVPWAGGAIVVAALGRGLLARLPRRAALVAALLGLGGFVVLEARNADVRETATRDALPVDRTLRDAVLLRHALAGLRSAALAPGTRVAFVNPVSRPALDVMTGAPTRPEDRPWRRSFWPLEAALRDGETLRVFLPGLEYLGFARTIPPGWEDAECFHFEQRGWLERWGRGRSALLRQAEAQLGAREWSAAESTLARMRARGDTVPEALRRRSWARRRD